MIKKLTLLTVLGYFILGVISLNAYGESTTNNTVFSSSTNSADTYDIANVTGVTNNIKVFVPGFFFMGTKHPASLAGALFDIAGQHYIGAPGIADDIKIAKAVTIGPELRYSYLSFGGNSQYRFYSAAISSNIALNGNVNRSGFLLNPRIGYEGAQGEFNGKTDKVEGGAVGALYINYQIMWNSGFNIQFGGGGLYYPNKSVSQDLGNNDRYGVRLDLSVGYAF